MEKLDRIMSKVSSGEELTKSDKKALSAALDMAQDGQSDAADKIMKKVRNGEELTRQEEKVLGAVIDASKAKNESTEGFSFHNKVKEYLGRF